MEDHILRIMGAVCILTSTALWGEMKARSLGLRLTQLQHLQQALRLLATEITYTATPLPHAFQRIGNRVRGPVGEIFIVAADYMKNHDEMSAGDAWKQALQQKSEKTFFTGEDLKVAEQLGVSLGLSDGEGQLKQIHMVSQQLEYALEESRHARNRNERMWRYLGVLGGLAIIIFFCRREGKSWILI